MKPICAYWVIVLLAGAAFADQLPTGLNVADLRCEQDIDPLGVDAPQPRLSWTLASPERGQMQTAYQVLVASKPALLIQNRGDLWDSGQVASDETQGISYGGRALESAQQVFWKVRVWDRSGRVGAWSTAGMWTMDVLRAADWHAHWISDPELIRWKRPQLGYHSTETADANAKKWVQLDLGEPRKIDAVCLDGVRSTVVEGTGFPRRFRVEAANEPGFRTSSVIADFSAQDYPDPWTLRIRLPAADVTGRYVRLTAGPLRIEEGRACLALSQIEVISGGMNIAVGAGVTASDSWEQAPWSARALTDGLGAPGAIPRANGTLRLRREFGVRPGLRRALLQLCGLGQYELTLNGARVGQGLLAPGWTDCDKTCLYDTLDATSWLRTGANAMGLCLAGGMYNVQEGRYVKFVTEFRPLTAIGQLRLEYADGTVEFVGTDEQWRVTPGPVTFANVYGGEDYDARRDPRGWDSPGFDDHAWGHAVLFDGPKGQLCGHSRSAPPLATFEALAPVGTHPLRPGVTVYDLGQNASLMLWLKVRGPAGAVVRIVPAELLAADGSVDRGSVGGAAWWQYTLAGTGAAEEWRPRDFYHGARYLQVESLAPEGGVMLPAIESIEGLVVHSMSAPVGQFYCSNELFNRIHTLVRWAQRSNLASVLTDCPHRERLGWLEQTHLNGPALRYEFDLTRLLAKTAGDMADAQQADGLVPDTAPEFVKFPDGFRDSPEWGSACVLVPWQQYEWTGDADLLRRSYAMMKRYVDYLGSRATDRVVAYGLGDWFDLGPNPPGRAQLTPVALTATAFYYQDAWILSRVAALVGKPAEAARYEELARQLRAAFNRAFFDPATGRYATGSQCANAIPLVMDLVEPARRAGVLAAIVADVRGRGNALTAGDVGYRYLLRALADAGRSDVIFDLNNQSEKPGYGYQLAQGATSLTEAWDADRRASQNHFMLGQINEWFYHDLAGIQGDPEGPGFKKIIIKPAIVGDLTWVRADYRSVRGRITSTWKRTGSQLSLRVSIPANTTATVYVPAKDANVVTEGDRPAGQGPDARFLRVAEGCAVYAVGSGNYAFASTLPP
jgi:alpha-L-rhamnosidase